MLVEKSKGVLVVDLGRFEGEKWADLEAFILQSVSKKTTHRSSLGNRLFLWFFLPPKREKIHIFWRYDIMVSPRGGQRKRTEGHGNENHKNSIGFQSVL